MTSVGPSKRAAAVIVGGWAVFTLIAYGQYLSKTGAYRGALRAVTGDQLGATALAEGVAGNIMIGLLLMGLVFAFVFVAAYAAVDIRGGVIAAVLCFLSLGVLGSLVAHYVNGDSQIAALAASDAGSHPSQWADAFSFVLWPSIAGLVAGWFAVRNVREQQEREQNRPVILTGEARTAAERELREREARAIAAAKRRVMAEKAAAAGRSDPAIADATSDVAAQVAIPASVPPESPGHSSTQRLAIVCRKCGASNAPMRAECLQCGFSLAE